MEFIKHFFVPQGTEEEEDLAHLAQPDNLGQTPHDGKAANDQKESQTNSQRSRTRSASSSHQAALSVLPVRSYSPADRRSLSPTGPRNLSAAGLKSGGARPQSSLTRFTSGNVSRPGGRVHSNGRRASWMEDERVV